MCRNHEHMRLNQWKKLLTKRFSNFCVMLDFLLDIEKSHDFFSVASRALSWLWKVPCWVCTFLTTDCSSLAQWLDLGLFTQSLFRWEYCTSFLQLEMEKTIFMIELMLWRFITQGQVLLKLLWTSGWGLNIKKSIYSLSFGLVRNGPMPWKHKFICVPYSSQGVTSFSSRVKQSQVEEKETYPANSGRDLIPKKSSPPWGRHKQCT